MTGENLEKLLNVGVEINLKLTKGLIKAIPELLKSVPRILKALVKGFISYHLNMAEVGANIIKSLGSYLACNLEANLYIDLTLQNPLDVSNILSFTAL